MQQKKHSIYQIDQSFKIENTSKTTYVCLANSKIYIASINAKDKRLLKSFFRELERPLIFKLFIFSVLCAKVIHKIKPNSVEIDKEYLGHEIDIKSFIVQIISIWNGQTVNITFGSVGKNSTAHIEGYKAYKNNIRGVAVKAKEILILYNLVNKA